MIETARNRLPAWNRVLVVVAHPDDESFGLGALIDAFVEHGTEARVLCLTAGEASTLNASDDLGRVRAVELERAAAALRVSGVELLQLPDGRLQEYADEAADAVRRAVERHRPEGLLVLDPSGVTGHPDHRAATQAALLIADEHDLPVVGWTLPQSVAERLDEIHGASMVGHPPEQIDYVIPIDRRRQRIAVAAHATQAVPGSILWDRLALLGDQEYCRLLRPR